MRRGLRKFLDFALAATRTGKAESLRPLVQAVDAFFFEVSEEAKEAPFIRDAVDVKRWMTIVVVALLPCIAMAVWNSGLQKVVFSSGDPALMHEYVQGSHSIGEYFEFAVKEGRWLRFFWEGMKAFFPIVLISYAVGGVCEVFFAVVRKKEVAEGLLVTGILVALILPPTIPYWMVAVGVASGIILSKEIFGGTGMNVLNPAICCRALLFFAFPAQMTGDVWVGTSPSVVREALISINTKEHLGLLDGYTQATPLGKMKVGLEVSRIHVDAIAANFPGVEQVPTEKVIREYWGKWSQAHGEEERFGSLSQGTLRRFLTDKKIESGLQLSPERVEEAWKFAQVQYEQGILTSWNLFLGNRAGSFGETSILACLIGAGVLILTGVGSWRTMIGVLVGVVGTAGAFKILLSNFGADVGAWTPAMCSFSPYKHLLLGGVMFGAVFMATDPVSSPVLRLSRWIYGALIGFLVMIIRMLSPAYPEGTMLAIILGNVASPLIDHHVARWYRRKACVTV